MKTNPTLQSMLTHLAQDAALPNEIDLWPTIQARLDAGKTFSQAKETEIKTNTSKIKRYRAVFIGALIILLVLGMIFVLPQGMALAQEMMHFFNRGASNLITGVTVTPVIWVEQTPGVAAATFTPQPLQSTPLGPTFEESCGSYNAPHCTIESIRNLVTFPVFALAKLPEGMHFTGATGGPDQVHLTYETSNQAGFLLIWEEPFTGAERQLAWEVGANADIQSVMVGAVAGEYVKGSYDGNSNPPIWNPDADLQMLRWVERGILVNLYMSGSEPRLGRDDLAALAATLTDGPVGEDVSVVAATATPAPTDEPFDPHTYFPLTLATAEEKAGFKLLSPSLLPEGLRFIGAMYDEETKVVEIYYLYNYPEATDGLLVSEQLAPEGVDCDLCGFIQGDGKQVEQFAPGKLVSENAIIETVKIGAFTGQYLEGIGWTSRTECCGWQWDSTPYIKRLRFRAGELAINITSSTFELTKEDVIAIAESLK